MRALTLSSAARSAAVVGTGLAVATISAPLLLRRGSSASSIEAMERSAFASAPSPARARRPPSRPTATEEPSSAPRWSFPCSFTSMQVRRSLTTAVAAPPLSSHYDQHAAHHLTSSLHTPRRGVFYRPETEGMHRVLPAKTGNFWGKRNLWQYRHIKPDPLPYPEPSSNNLYGRQRLWNAIPSAAGVAAKKAHDFGFPERDPPPKGLRESPEYYPYFVDKYFPDVECRLVLDSVLNVDTTTPAFEFPPHMSRGEIANYLRNVHGIENIIAVRTRNISGRCYKNEIGIIKQLPDVKVAVVVLDAPVRIDFKQVKTSEESEAQINRDPNQAGASSKS